MEEVATKKFLAIFQSSGFQSLEAEDLASLKSYSELIKLLPQQKSSRLGLILCAILAIGLLVIVVPVASLVLVHHGYLSDVQFLGSFHKETARWFMEEYVDLGFEEESCLMETIESVESLFRPPVDCSVCQNITKVQRVSNISREEFEEKFAYSGTPVVITDGMNDWTAQETYSFEYLKGVYFNESLGLPLDSPQGDCQFFPYRTKFSSLKQVFEMSSKRARLEDGSTPWYVGWSNCHSLIANTLRQHYSQPYFLPSESEASRTDWIFMGSPGYGAPIHIDNVGFPSWQAQIKGTKRWTLEPPPECYMECWDTGSIEVVVHPGEIIVLDTDRWFHQTLIEGEDMSITIGSEYD